ncbi:MAG: hypothetical protein HZB53_03185 [Chloroflexi bacterium]|nr:hypothetical protein [Chloroflexota bacterium]
MINLGVVDILLAVVLVSVAFYARRKREMLIFYLALVLVLLIEVERLVPGTLRLVGEGIRGIDTVNAALPHVEISPIITIRQ